MMRRTRDRFEMQAAQERSRFFAYIGQGYDPFSALHGIRIDHTLDEFKAVPWV
jgi:hypothetical protein